MLDNRYLREQYANLKRMIDILNLLFLIEDDVAYLEIARELQSVEKKILGISLRKQILKKF